MTANRTTLRLAIHGRVQGVFFRAWTREQARMLGVNGWVRNASDGSVEAHLEGDEAEVGDLIQRLREGPPFSRVEDVEYRWEDPTAEVRGFEAGSDAAAPTGDPLYALAMAARPAGRARRPRWAGWARTRPC